VESKENLAAKPPSNTEPSTQPSDPAPTLRIVNLPHRYFRFHYVHTLKLNVLFSYLILQQLLDLPIRRKLSLEPTLTHQHNLLQLREPVDGRHLGIIVDLVTLELDPADRHDERANLRAKFEREGGGHGVNVVKVAPEHVAVVLEAIGLGTDLLVGEEKRLDVA